jgi:N-acetylglucosamine malate deacetylase 1
MAKKFLVIAPHPDDEVLGCGGIMKKYSDAGHEVYVLIVTRGTPKKYSDERIERGRAQARKSHAILGVKDTFFMNYHAPELDQVPSYMISDSISELVGKLLPTDLFLPHPGDIHIDHQVVFNASLVAARPIGNCSVRNIFTYETLSETEWAQPACSHIFIPDHFVDIEKSFDFKLQAMGCYEGQLRNFPHPRSLESLEALAKFRGSTIGCSRAEAFKTIRTID